MKKLLRWLIGILLTVVVIVVALLAVVSVFQIPIDLSRFKEPVEVLASKALNRQVRIEKSIVISTSLNPYFTIGGLRIENPEGFTTDHFLSMDLAKIQVKLIPLLKRKVHITAIQVEGLDVKLEEAENGANNWVFDTNKETEKETPAKPEVKEEGKAPKKGLELAGDSLVVSKLDFKDIDVEFYRAGSKEPSRFELKTCLGKMLPNEPLQLDIDGALLESDYTVGVTIASLEQLLSENKSWMEIKLVVAETEMNFSGNVDLATAARSLDLQTTIQGENLTSLNDLLQLDLPPFTSYSLETALHLQPNQFELKKLTVKTGSSSLEGSAKIVKAESMTTVDAKFRSPLVQLDDFIFDDWSWTNEDAPKDPPAEVGEKEAKKRTASEEADKKENGLHNKKLADPEMLAKFDCTLAIDAEKVLSGEDLLGSGELKVTLKEGRIKIDPLVFNVPGGKIGMMASIKPGTEKSDAELKVKMKNFDIGIWVRRKKPESDMGGLVDLDIDVTSSAATMSEMLENGNGYFDFSGNLENFSSGIVDLWAVNLVAAIVSGADKSKSELNCAVGRWTVTDGILEPEAFFIDTSKIRICADGKVDLREQTLHVKVKPEAKKAQFFSLATPLEVKGSFADINVGVGQGGIIGTAVNFIASPVSVPLQRMVMPKIPADGSDVCGMILGAENREVVVPMCSVKK